MTKLMEPLQPNLKQHPVFFDMDGAIDDMIGLLTLMALDNCKLTGIALTNANCFSECAVTQIQRIIGLFGQHDLQVAISNAEPVNQFPEKWRAKSRLLSKLALGPDDESQLGSISKMEAAQFTAEKILEQDENTTVVLTGPATNLINAIRLYPAVLQKIDRVVWMAGAFLANGNVIAPDHDGSAEWNVFWDPASARDLLRTGVKIVLFPLDVCCQVSVDNYLLYHLRENSHFRLSQLVCDMLEIAQNNHPEYCMWDVLPCLFVGYPDIVRLSNTSIDIEMRGTSMGNMFKTSKGAPVHFASFVDDDKFYNCFIELMKKF